MTRNPLAQAHSRVSIGFSLRDASRLSAALAVLVPAIASAAATPPMPVPLPMNFEQFAAQSSLRSFDKSNDPTCLSDTCLNRRTEFRYVAYVGKQIYCYWEMKTAETRTDFDALAGQVEAMITDASDESDYFIALRTWASAFHDGHVNVLMRADASAIPSYAASIRVEILAPATDHEKVIVTQVVDAPQGGPRAVRVGDQILSVNGKPISQVLDEAETQMSGSTQRMRRFFASRRILDVVGARNGAAPLRVTLQRGQATSTVSLFRTVDPAPKPVALPPGAPNTGAGAIKMAILPGTDTATLGYLRIDGFGGEQSRFLLAQAMERLQGTSGLLIDVRKNGGGDQSGNEILARLVTQRIVRYRVSERRSDYLLANRPELTFASWDGRSLFVDWRDLAVQPLSTGSYVGKPVMVLTSPNCFSACDTFVSALKFNQLATVVGEGTGGGTGSPLVFDLPISQHQFRYSVVRGTTPAGDAIEGQGTLPDILLEPTLEERVAGEDRQLSTALSMLAAKLPGQQASPTEIAGSIASFDKPWVQSIDHSATLADELELRRLSKIDER